MEVSEHRQLYVFIVKYVKVFTKTGWFNACSHLRGAWWTGEAQHHSFVFLCDPLNPTSCHLSGRPLVKQVCLFVCLYKLRWAFRWTESEEQIQTQGCLQSKREISSQRKSWSLYEEATSAAAVMVTVHHWKQITNPAASPVCLPVHYTHDWREWQWIMIWHGVFVG